MNHQSFLFCGLLAGIFLTISCAKYDAIPVLTAEGEIDTELTTQDTINFAIIGDYGDRGDKAYAVSELVKSWQPEFILTTGDNNYDKGKWNTIEQNISQYYGDYIYNPDAPIDYQCTGQATIDETNRFFPVPGNHDYGNNRDPQPYLDFFMLPGNERNYEFIRGSVHFFALDSGKNGKNDNVDLKDWLRQSLANSTAPFKVVYFHHPSYSSGRHGSYPQMQWDFAEWGATAVLNGHDHIYQHIQHIDQPDFHYFVNGLGGRDLLYNCTANSLPDGLDSFCYNDSFGAMKVTATAAQLALSFINLETTVVETTIISL